MYSAPVTLRLVGTSYSFKNIACYKRNGGRELYEFMRQKSFESQYL